MTRDEIVKVLAERVDEPAFHVEGYLSDRNAVARVVGKMTEEERLRMDDFFWPKCVEKYQIRCVNALTLDPAVIAECAARAIVECKESPR